MDTMIQIAKIDLQHSARIVFLIILVSSSFWLLIKFPEANALATVTTSTSGTATGNDNQQKLIQAQTRYWFVYSDGTNLVYRTCLISAVDCSTNAASWSATTTLGAATQGFRGSIWYDSANNEFCYVRRNSVSQFAFRCGTLNTGGTVTWDFVETAITTTNQVDVTDPYILWISASEIWVVVNTLAAGPTNHVEIWKCATSPCSTTTNWSDKNDIATGVAAGSFQMTIHKVTSGLIVLYGTAFTTNAVIKIITTSNGGTTWSSTVSTTCQYSYGKSDTIAIGDTVYTVGLVTVTAGACTNGNITHFTFVFGAASTSAENVLDSGTSNLGAAISTDKTGCMALWHTATTIKFSTSSNCAFANFANTNSVLNTDTNIRTSTLSASYFTVSNQVEISYTQGTASPFNVKFDLVSFNAPQIIQSKSCTFTGSSGTCAFTSNTKLSSSILVIAATTATTGVSTVTDSQLLSYTLVKQSNVGTVGDIEGWLACDISSAAADTITVTYSVSVTSLIILYELTHTDCTPASSSGSSASTTSPTVASYTPGNPTLVIAAINTNCEVACTITGGTGYALDINTAVSTVNEGATEYIQNFGTAETSPMTFSVASAHNEISIAFSPVSNVAVTFSKTMTLSPTFKQAVAITKSPSLSLSATFAVALSLHTFTPSITLAPAFSSCTTPPFICASGISTSVGGEEQSYLWLLLIPLILIVLVVASKRR